MKQLFKYAGLVCGICLGATTVQAQSVTAYKNGSFDVGGTTEYSQYLYIGPGASITIPSGKQWIIASRYVFIAPGAVIGGAGQMIIENPGKIGSLNETVAWAGQPTVIDGGGAIISAPVIHRNPNNLVLDSVPVVASNGDITTANTSHTLRIGTNFTWASTHADGTALTGNDVILGKNDLRFGSTATQTGYDVNSYAVTNGTGHVVKDSYTGSWVYPVGRAENDYTPAAINNATANGMHVLVQDYATSASAEGGTNGINRTWNIYADNAAGNSTINLQHNLVTNQTDFDNAACFVTRHGATAPNTSGQSTQSTTAWQSNTPGAGSASGSLTTGTPIAGASERSLAYTSFATSATPATAFFSKTSNSVTPLGLAPNLAPTISFLPSSIIGTQNVNVIVNVSEFNDVATGGTISVYIPKTNTYTLTYNPTATTLSGQAVQNSAWTFNSTSSSSFYILTTNTVIPASGNSRLGFTTTYNPNNQTGFTQISAIIGENSGGEASSDSGDNTDNDNLNFSF